MITDAEWVRIKEIAKDNPAQASDSDKQFLLDIYKRELDAGAPINTARAQNILRSAKKAGFDV